MSNERLVAQWLAQVVYKPGWEMSVIAPGWMYSPGVVTVAISAMVEDSCHPGNQVSIGSVAVVPENIVTFERFCDWLFHTLYQREKHECQEWLRWADTRKPINSPHLLDHG